MKMDEGNWTMWTGHALAIMIGMPIGQHKPISFR